jgi:hypothetical protein
MLIFIVKSTTALEDEATIMIPLFKVNAMAQAQWNAFVRDTTGDQTTNPYFNQQKWDFLGYMQTYGERGLEAYAYARNHGNEAALAKWDHVRPFYEMAQQPEFCFLTRFGILNHLNWAGVVINTNRAETLLGLDASLYTQRYLHVNVGYAKRIECAQLFGSSDDITTGSRLWITLTRKRCHDGKFGAFVLRPGGSKKIDTPLMRDRCYADESGHMCTGHVWHVGVVINPPTEALSVVAQEQANNTGESQDDMRAYKMHAEVPSMWVAVGYKH